MKLLLYCTKSKPYLMNLNTKYFISSDRESLCYIDKQDMKSIALNGKIIAECDFEIEKIETITLNEDLNDLLIKSEKEKEVLEKSCFTKGQLYGYLENGTGYAIHIKNLHIFDKPRELENYDRINKENCFEVLNNAPQNMMKICERMNEKEKYILISIRPEWLCKILNGEKTIECRKRVLKEMTQNVL